jgi:hypothetical protein
MKFIEFDVMMLNKIVSIIPRYGWVVIYRSLIFFVSLWRFEFILFIF